MTHYNLSVYNSTYNDNIKGHHLSNVNRLSAVFAIAFGRGFK